MRNDFEVLDPVEGKGHRPWGRRGRLHPEDEAVEHQMEFLYDSTYNGIGMAMERDLETNPWTR